MDNKNEFIHIDELFQKLRHTVQEEYRSEDAWSRMKNLLDEEMPVTDPVRGSGRKRYFIPLLALLLGIGGATTGYQYYQYQQQQSSGTLYATAVQDIINTTPGTPVSVPQHTTGASSAAHTGPKTSGHQAAAAKSRSGNAIAASASASGSNGTNTGVQPQQQASYITAVSGNKNIQGTQHIRKEQPGTLTLNKQHPAEAIQLPVAAAGSGIWHFRNPVAHLLGSSTASLMRPSKAPDNTGNKHPAAEQLEKLLLDKTGQAVPHVQQPAAVPVIQVARQTARTEEAPAIHEPRPVSTATPEIISTVTKNNVTYVQKNDGQWYKEEEEKVKFIHAIRRQDENRQYYIDTQSVEENIVVKHLPVDESIVTGRTENSFGSTAVASNSNFTDLKVLNDSKVKAYSGEKESGSFFKKYILKDDIYKLFNRSNKFEAMINFGGMYAPAATGSYGFHLGIGGIYNLTERLDMGLEARYVRKSFSNFYQEDEQKQYNVSQNGSLFSGTETITSYEYTIRNYNSIEIPLYLSYKIGDRLSVMGGIQYVYAAPIKWQLKTNTAVNDNFASVEMPQNTNAVFNQQNDFSARSGLGFMAGIGFDASKRISLDFRVSQNFYSQNNSSNNSINSIYNAPVFGLTLGYFFGKKDKIYYLMQNSKR